MLKARQTLDKYRIGGRIGSGGFANVYRAYDTIEGIPVALKIPHKWLLTRETLEDFRKEVRLMANLDHPNILPIKNASYIGKVFVIVYPLGEGTLSQRLTRRMSSDTALSYAGQMLDALSFAHSHRIIHCDIKPANFILFPNGRIRLADFGIAKVALGTQAMSASGTGTLGYVAPEQALGKPTLRSDVFSLGLVLYRMFSGGLLPGWPYDWPPPDYGRMRKRYHREFLAFLRRALEVDERLRYKDAQQMQAAFERVRSRAVRTDTRRRRRSRRARRDWKTIRLREFKRRYGSQLETRAACGRCGGPMAETMPFCPWCGSRRRVYKGPSSFPERCRRCGRGMKLDWRFCPWCFGAGVEPDNSREYSDVRYEARCQNRSCKRKLLMPFMRYCPWCRTKVTRRWKIAGSTDKCPRCGWGVPKEFWSHCAWCGRTLGKHATA